MHPSARPAPGTTAALRSANVQRVLEVLRTGATAAPEGGHSQAGLARTTGLAAATVSTIVRQLVAQGLVEAVPGSGRRGSTVRLARQAGVVAGVDVGRSHLSVALGDLSGSRLDSERAPLEPGHAWQEGLGAARAMLLALLERQGLERGAVRGVGLGLPAPLSDGVVQSSVILPGWVGVDAAAVATEQLEVPAHVDNDANLGALGEAREGAGQGCRSLVYVKAASGVGAGIVLEDRLFRGAGGTAGEVGHLTLDETGPVCRCGSRGCLEAYASVTAVVAMLSAQLPGAGFDDVLAAARGGGTGAVRALEDAGTHLGWGIASVVNLLNPEVVLLGGEMARAGELVLDAVRVGLRRHALEAVAATPVRLSALGGDASLVGALHLAADATPLLPA